MDANPLFTFAKKTEQEMTKNKLYEEKTTAIAEPICNELGFSLYDVEFVNEAGTNYLRVYIDKPDGISVDECEIVSRRMNDILDEQDFVEESYIFEVSSPGLTRILKKDRHFEQSLGSEVEVKLFKPVDKKKEYTGYLDDFDENTVTIGFDNDTEIVIERSNIAKINLAIHF